MGWEKVVFLAAAVVMMQLLPDASTISLSNQTACTYADSTCSGSSCSQSQSQTLCTSGHLFALLPSFCHPAYQRFVSVSDSHPDKSPPSLQLPLSLRSQGFTVPSDLLPADSFSSTFTISIYFKPTPEDDNATLLQLGEADNELIVSYFGDSVELEHRETVNSLFLSLNLSNDTEPWKAVAVTVSAQGVFLSSEGSSNFSSTELKPVSSIDTAVIGDNFAGLIQDVIFYNQPIQDFDFTSSLATFLPQCYCLSGSVIVTSDNCMEVGKDTTTPRYNVDSREATDFAADTSSLTVWQSNADVSPVTFVLGLSEAATLSKIIVSFPETPPFLNATLQFFSNASSEWLDLQYYAVNCTTSFGLDEDAQLTSGIAVNCLPVPTTSLLTFFIRGTSDNVRPSLADYSHFTASRVRLIMEGFSKEANNMYYSIQDFQVCADFCQDLVANCSCTSPVLNPTATLSLNPTTSQAFSSSQASFAGSGDSLAPVSLTQSTSSSSVEKQPAASSIQFSTTSTTSPLSTTTVEVRASSLEAGPLLTSLVEEPTLAIPVPITTLEGGGMLSTSSQSSSRHFFTTLAPFAGSGDGLPTVQESLLSSTGGNFTSSVGSQAIEITNTPLTTSLLTSVQTVSSQEDGFVPFTTTHITPTSSTHVQGVLSTQDIFEPSQAVELLTTIQPTSSPFFANSQGQLATSNQAILSTQTTLSPVSPQPLSSLPENFVSSTFTTAEMQVSPTSFFDSGSGFSSAESSSQPIPTSASVQPTPSPAPTTVVPPNSVEDGLSSTSTPEEQISEVVLPSAVVERSETSLTGVSLETGLTGGSPGRSLETRSLETSLTGVSLETGLTGRSLETSLTGGSPGRSLETRSLETSLTGGSLETSVIPGSSEGSGADMSMPLEPTPTPFSASSRSETTSGALSTSSHILQIVLTSPAAVELSPTAILSSSIPEPIQISRLASLSLIESGDDVFTTTAFSASQEAPIITSGPLSRSLSLSIGVTEFEGSGGRMTILEESVEVSSGHVLSTASSQSSVSTPTLTASITAPQVLPTPQPSEGSGDDNLFTSTLSAQALLTSEVAAGLSSTEESPPSSLPVGPISVTVGSGDDILFSTNEPVSQVSVSSTSNVAPQNATTFTDGTTSFGLTPSPSLAVSFPTPSPGLAVPSSSVENSGDDFFTSIRLPLSSELGADVITPPSSSSATEVGSGDEFLTTESFFTEFTLTFTDASSAGMSVSTSLMPTPSAGDSGSGDDLTSVAFSASDLSMSQASSVMFAPSTISAVESIVIPSASDIGSGDVFTETLSSSLEFAPSATVVGSGDDLVSDVVEPTPISSLGLSPSVTVVTFVTAVGSGDDLVSDVIEPTPFSSLETTPSVTIAGSGNDLLSDVIQPTPSSSLEFIPSASDIGNGDVFTETPSSSLEFAPSATVVGSGDDLVSDVVEPTPISSLGLSPSVTVVTFVTAVGSGDDLLSNVIEPTPFSSLETTPSVTIAGSGDDLLSDVIQPTLSSSLETTPSVAIGGSGDDLLSDVIEPTPFSSLETTPSVAIGGSGDDLLSDVIEPTPSSSLETTPSVAIGGSGDDLLSDVIEPTPSSSLETTPSVAIGGSGDDLLSDVIQPTPSSSLETTPSVAIGGSGDDLLSDVIQPTPSSSLETTPSVAIAGSGDDLLSDVIEPTPSSSLETTPSVAIAGSGDDLLSDVIEPTPFSSLETTPSVAIGGSGDDLLSDVIEPTPFSRLETIPSVTIVGSGDDLVSDVISSSSLEFAPSVTIVGSGDDLLSDVIEPTPAPSVTVVGSGDDLLSDVIEPTPALSVTVVGSGDDLLSDVIEPTPAPSVTVVGSGDDLLSDVIEPTSSTSLEFVPSVGSGDDLVSDIIPSPSLELIPSVTAVGSGDDFFSDSIEPSSFDLASSVTTGFGDDDFFSTFIIRSTVEPSFVFMPSSVEGSGLDILFTMSDALLTASVLASSSIASDDVLPPTVSLVLSTPSVSPFLSGSGSGLDSGSGLGSGSGSGLDSGSGSGSGLGSGVGSGNVVIIPSGTAPVTMIPETTGLVDSSSAVSSSVQVTPSPSPSPPAVCDLQNVSLPAFPVRVETGGSVFFDQLLSSSESPQYSTSIASYIRPDVEENPAAVQVTLGDFTTSLPVTQTTPASNLLDIFAVVSDVVIHFDNPHTTLALQVRDSNSFSTNFEIEVMVIIQQSNFSLDYNCSTRKPSGVCTINVTNIPREWFLEGETNTVPVFAWIDEGEMTKVSELVLSATMPLYLPNTTYLNLPRRPAMPGEQVLVTATASFNYLLLGFSMDCRLLGPAIFKDAEATFEWSLLTDVFNSSERQIAVTGFRNYNKTNIQETRMSPDNLFTLAIFISPNASSSSVHVQCEAVKLTLTTGPQLDQQKVDVLGRCSSCGIEISNVMPRNVFAYAEQNELVNLVPLTRNFYQVPLGFRVFSSDGSLSQLPSHMLDCSSNSTDIIQAADDCTVAFFSGSETSGSDVVSILIDFKNLSAIIPFKIWYVDDNSVVLEVEDRELNLVTTSDCAVSNLYQKTPVSILASISTSSSLDMARQLIITSHLLANVTSSNTSMATVSNGFVQGEGTGTVDIFLSHTPSVFVTINVTDTPVCLALRVLAFSNISIQFPQLMSQAVSQSVTITVLQDFQHVIYLVSMAVYSDGYATEVIQGVEYLVGMERVQNSSVYTIRDVATELNITAEWDLGACSTASDELSIQPNRTPPQLHIRLSSHQLTRPDDIASYFDIPTYLQVEAVLLYPDGSEVLVPNDSLNFSSEGALQRHGDRVEVASDRIGMVQLTATYDFHGIILTNSTTVFINTAELELVATPMSTLKQVGSSGKIQPAVIKAILSFSNGTEQNVSSFQLSVRALDHTEIINTTRLEEDNNLMLDSMPTQPINISLEGYLLLMNGTTCCSENLLVMVSSDPAEVVSIDDIMLSQSDSNNEVFVDCTITLDDMSRLHSTFQNGSPLYPDLLFISTSDNDAIEIANSSNGIFRMVKNSLDTVSISVFSSSGHEQNRTFYSNLFPGVGEVDLGSAGIDTKPLNDVSQGDSFLIPVVLNSNTKLGVYELRVLYEPVNALEFDSGIQGEDWRNGSLIFAAEVGMVTISGVLVTGAVGSSIELAVLEFTVDHEFNGNVGFTVEVIYLTEATVNLNPISFFPSTNQVEMRVTSSSDRRRRSARYPEVSRFKREVAVQSVSGDYNNDMRVDQRDVYLLQVYIASEVYNFTTSQGTQVIDITNEIPNANFNQIAVLERTSLNATYSVSDIQYQYFLDPADSQCRQMITGVVTNFNSDVSTTGAPEFVHVFLSFKSSNNSFDDEFGEANFTGISMDPVGTTVEASLEAPNGTIIFTVTGNAFSTEFSVDVILIVEVGAVADDDAVNLIGSVYAQTVQSLNSSGLLDMCSDATTEIPTTPEPTTPEATTPEATTPEATTPEATTPEATTPEATTPEATTPEVTTPEATTPEATTPEATTPEATTPEPTTPEATTPEPTTPEATTPEATTPEATTLEPTTPEVTTPEATTPEATTPEATTPEATTPEATTPEATTPEATTLEPTTPEVTTPEATTPEATTPEATTPEPTTPEATTPEATTPEATTPEPTTPEVTTPEATTPEATTPEATTPEATTPEPTTPEPTTPEATTPEATTPEATTSEATTPEPTTPEVTTPEATTPEATTPEATTPEPTTPEATTPEPTTPEATTPEATTPEATTLEPTTPEVTTPEATTPEATTPEPTTPEATTPEPTTQEPTTPEATTLEDTTSGTSTLEGTSSGSSTNVGATVFSVLAVVAVMLIVVIVSTLLIWGFNRHRRKRRGKYKPTSNHSTTRATHDFWFGEEEKIEMSPIDIVPLEENMYEMDVESNMDIVPNHRIYHSERTDSTIFSNMSALPLVQQHPPTQQSNHRVKQSHSMFTDVTVESAPPYTSGTALTAKTGNSASSYEMDEDDAFDFKFDDAQTQPYLSLGLTPLSQLSPPDHGPSASSGGDSYFFPSMPPPVTPISSVFSINNSSSNTGIPVDNPFALSAGMVMPEANPVVESGGRRGGRRRHEVNAHSQGYAMKLEPLVEHSCSFDEYAEPRIVTNGLDSSSSSAEDSSLLLVNPDSKLPSHLHRKAGRRRKSGTRRVLDSDNWDETDMSVVKNPEVFDYPVKLSREENSPRQEGKKIRQQAREEELARQKEILRTKQLEDEKVRLMQQEQRAAQIRQDYGSSRHTDPVLALSPRSAGLVMEQAMRYEAQAQLMKEQIEKGASPNMHHSRQTSNPNVIVSTSNQFSVL